MLLFPQGAQQRGNLCRACGVHGGADEVLHSGVPLAHGGVQVFLMHHADDVVDGLVIHRQAGVAALGKGVGQFVQRNIVGHRHHVHTGGQHFLHFHIIKFDGGADQLAFPVGEFPVIFRLTHHGEQLGIGDHIVLAAVEKAVQQLFPAAEQKIQRGEQGDEYIEDGRTDDRKFFRHFLGEALGGDLAKNQHQHRDDHSGHRGAILPAAQPDKQHRAEGGHGNVDNVVADEDGGQQVVVAFGERQHLFGLLVAGIRPAFQANLVERGIGGF